jgi:KRAB domain-containing zinc finger protein
VHLGLKPHACSLCEAAFPSVSHLKSHLSLVHLGLKPYECEWCVAAYASSSSLKAHMASAHPDVDAVG